MRRLMIMLVGLSATACGTGHGSSNSKPRTAATVTVTITRRATVAAKPGAPPVTETVRIARAGVAWTAGARAQAGQSVQFRTVLSQPAAGDVRLVFARGPGKSLSVTATAGGHSSRATLTSAGGTDLTLLALHYTCTAPPDPGFCPVHGVRTSSSTATLFFHASAQAPIFVGATVGPAKLPRLARSPSAAAVTSGYRVVAAGGSVTEGPGGKEVASPLRSSVTVKSGDLLLLVARLLGRPAGAPGPLRMTLAQGPGTSLTASATVAGHPGSRVQIRSSTGSPVRLVLPRYTCFVPPVPTACPAARAGAMRGTYTVEFPVSGALPVISLLAGVRGTNRRARH